MDQHNNEIQDSVDSIFEDADKVMQQQAIKREDLSKPLGYDLQYKIKKWVKITLIGAIVFIIITIGLAGYYAWKVIPYARSEVARQVNLYKNSMINVDNEKLTIEEQYQKEMIMALSDESIERMINHISIKEILSGIQSPENMFDLTIYITDEDKEKIDNIQQKYEENKTQTNKEQNTRQNNSTIN